MSDNNEKKHDKVLAIVLCVFVGFLGIHQFYMGNKGFGAAYFSTWFLSLICLNIADSLPQTLGTLGFLVLIVLCIVDIVSLAGKPREF